MKVLSLFANIGVAEAYFEEIGVDVVVANELIERRARLYSEIYPKTNMVCGDITNPEIMDRIVGESKRRGVEIVMATPPCQGMSTAGHQKDDDERNKLISYVLDVVKQIHPRYVFIENVPLFLNTYIQIGNEKILIPELIKRELGKDYVIRMYVVDVKDYGVPQMRERALLLLSEKSEMIQWELPEKEDKLLTMEEAIGSLPMLDPYVKDISDEERKIMFPHYEERKAQALKISPWHKPPHHIKRQVVAMQHTPTGCSAFDNDIYFPVKEDGKPVKGYHNTYSRQKWNVPAYTVTMDNRKISSQNNVHPGRLEYVNSAGEYIYSDARTLTLYELMIIMSLPHDWPVPIKTSEAFLRRIIGEGIPPLFVKKVFMKLIEGVNEYGKA